MSVLKNVLLFTGLVVDVPMTIAHGLSLNGRLVAPDLVLPSSVSGYVVTANATDVTVIREDGSAASVSVLVERWHSIECALPSLGELALPFIVSAGGGTTGPVGPTGPAGPQGIQGVAGNNGIAGANGIDGATGATGATGNQGIQGIQGTAGIDGSDGATGAIGPQGNPGVDGTSVMISATTLALPYSAREHRIVVVDVACSPSSRIVASVTGSDEDENSPDMDNVRVFGIPASGQWTAVVSCDQPIGGPLRIFYQVG